MKTINLPENLDEVLWDEYIDLVLDRKNEFKGYKKFLEYKLSNPFVSGNVVKGIQLTFETEEDLTAFVLRWL